VTRRPFLLVVVLAAPLLAGCKAPPARNGVNNFAVVQDPPNTPSRAQPSEAGIDISASAACVRSSTCAMTMPDEEELSACHLQTPHQPGRWSPDGSV
jgi:hypothetical protein